MESRKLTSFFIIWTSLFIVVLYLQIKKPTVYRKYFAFRYHRYFDTNIPEKSRLARQMLTSRYDIKGLNSENPDLVITVVTCHRQIRVQYIHLTMASILREVEKSTANYRVKVIVCNSQQGIHFPGYLAYLRYKLQIIRRILPLEVDVFDKERADYAYCLKRSLSMTPSAKYILMIEDDVILRTYGSSFFPTLRYFVEQAEKRRKKPFAYMKLYHPPRLLGYIQPEIERHLEVFAICSIFMTIFRLLSQSSCRQMINLRRYITNWPLLTYFFIIFLYILDRHWVLEIRELFKYTHLLVPTTFCCTPCILFQRNPALQFVSYLDIRKCNESLRKDHLLFDFYHNGTLPAYQIQPNLVAHIGTVSSLHNEGVELLNL